MFSKLSLSISAALLLSAAGGVARAAPASSRSDISAAESGTADSKEYSKRVVSLHSPSNEEINAGESGNPDSVDYRQGISSASASAEWKKNWEAVEVGNPDFR